MLCIKGKAVLQLSTSRCQQVPGRCDPVMYGQTLAAAAGLCAALAALSAKLAVAGEATQQLCNKLVGKGDSQILPISCESVVLYVRLLFFGLTFVFNGRMWTLFVRSLQLCSSSIQATATNTASNFCFSAVFGFVFFGEALPVLWWCGMSLVLMGLVLINRGSQEKEKLKES